MTCVLSDIQDLTRFRVLAPNGREIGQMVEYEPLLPAAGNASICSPPVIGLRMEIKLLDFWRHIMKEKALEIRSQ